MDLLVEAELRRAAERPGCVLCRLGEEAAVHYLRSVLGEGTTDGATRSRLGRSWGFCTRHAWQVLGLEWHEIHDSLGTATILEGLLESLERLITTFVEDKRGHARRRGAGVAGLALALQPGDLCPACRIQSEHEQYAATVLVRALDWPEWRQQLAASAGLCLRHWRHVLLEAETPERRQWLIEEQRRRLDKLRTELEVYGRKHDYRFSQEGFGPERDVVVRATDALAGSWFALPRRPRAQGERREGTCGV